MTEPATKKVDLLERFYKDGKDRQHVPPLTPLMAGLRAGQLVVNLIVLILAAISAREFNPFELDAHGMAFFTFAWTLLFFGYVYGTAIWVPDIYNVYAHITGEALTNLWWLVTWALSASHASDVPSAFRGLFIDTLRAVAGLGALQWLLFCASLFFLVKDSMLKLRELGTVIATTGSSAGGGAVAPNSSAPAADAQAVSEVPAQSQTVELDPYAANLEAGSTTRYPDQTTMPDVRPPGN